jgi:subtilase family serine protease
MGFRTWALGALGLASAIIGASASAQFFTARQIIERSGGIYHRALCSAFVPPGTARCHAHVVTDSRGSIMPGMQPNGTRPAGYSPADLRSAYRITAMGSTASLVAIVDAYSYPNAQKDLAVYRAQYGLPPCTGSNGCFRKIGQNGGNSTAPFDVNWAGETALDLDMVSAMCPNCKILLVEANSSSLSDLAAAVNTAAARHPIAISNSYGGDEAGSSFFKGAYVHSAIAITASSGDSGYGVQFPASAPHVIAVGGTRLLRAPTTGRGWQETVWSGAGSGCSKVYAKPSWQLDPLCLRRMVADVSAVADPATGVAAYAPVSATAASWQVYGGTSVAAPIIAALFGVRGRALNGPSTFYAKPTAFYDIRKGTNGSCGGIYFCVGGVGYDGPTGVGTPEGLGGF